MSASNAPTSGYFGTLPVFPLFLGNPPGLWGVIVPMRTLLLSLTALSLALAACTPLDPPDPGQPGQDGLAETPTLTGTRWDLTQYGDPTAPQTPVVDSHPVLVFEQAGQLGHTTGCNGMGGDYTLDGTALTVGNLMQTMMACDDPLMTQEAAISHALQSATTLTQTGDALVIAYPGGELRYTRAAEPKPASLMGSEWQLDTLIMGDSAQSLVAGSAVTLTFAEDGLSGNGGCNAYHAGWSGDEMALSVTAIGSTKMACADQAISDQETRYFGLLQAVTTYSIAGNHLTLTGPDGALVFVTTP